MLHTLISRLKVTAVASYLSAEFVQAVRDWIVPKRPEGKAGSNVDWSYRAGPLKVIEDAGIPAEYRQGGLLYRGITVTYPDYIKLKGKYLSSKASSWTTVPITSTKGVGLGVRQLGNYVKVKSEEDIPKDHAGNAMVIIIFKKKIPSSQVILNVNDLFTDPQYKVDLKSTGKPIKTNDKLFKSGWENEVIVKPDIKVTSSDVEKEIFYIDPRDDAHIERFRQMMRD